MVERSGVEACKAAVHNLLAQRVSGLIINYPLDDQDAIAVEAACANVPALFLDVSDQTPSTVLFSPMKTVRDWAWSIWSHWVTSKSRC
jgi:DNA-binding LacI/PurR family transcriptional regulator